MWVSVSAVIKSLNTWIQRAILQFHDNPPIHLGYPLPPKRVQWSILTDRQGPTSGKPEELTR